MDQGAAVQGMQSGDKLVWKDAVRLQEEERTNIEGE